MASHCDLGKAKVSSGVKRDLNSLPRNLGSLDENQES